jgi:hypothetical protein
LDRVLPHRELDRVLPHRELDRVLRVRDPDHVPAHARSKAGNSNASDGSAAMA